jgi:hypothetical protein
LLKKVQILYALSSISSIIDYYIFNCQMESHGDFKLRALKKMVWQNTSGAIRLFSLGRQLQSLSQPRLKTSS